MERLRRSLRYWWSMAFAWSLALAARRWRLGLCCCRRAQADAILNRFSV